MSIDRDPIFTSKNSTALPYAGTTGASGSATSRERAENEAADGTAAARQRRIIDLLGESGGLGMTWREISDKTGQHHGQVSGALSSMHKAGEVVALRHDRRNGCGVYVLPGNVLGRITRPFNENKAKANGTEAPAPIVAPRPRLTGDEKVLIEKITKGMANSSDQPFIRVKPDSMRTLLRALERLDGDQK
jgi:hypothetical protein